MSKRFMKIENYFALSTILFLMHLKKDLTTI